MAKRLSGSECHWDGEWGRSRDGVLNVSGDRRRGRAVLGVNLGRLTVTNGNFVA